MKTAYSQGLLMGGERGKRLSRPYFIFIAAVTVFLYFELMTQVWFLNLIRGYLIKVWVPPLLLFLYVVAKKLLKKGNLLKFSFLNFMLIFYAVFGITAMLVNESLYFAMKFYLIMIAPIFFYAVIIDYFQDNRDIELMIKVLVVCSFLLSIYTHNLQDQQAKSPYSVQRQTVTSAGNVIGLSEGFFVESGKLQSRGLLGYEHGKYGSMLAPAILFSILLFLKSKSKIKYACIGMSGFIIVQIIDTLSRSGIISVFVGIIVLMSCYFLYEKEQRGKILLLCGLILVIFLGYLFKYQFNAVLRFLQILNILEIQAINDFLGSFGISAFSTESYIDPHYSNLIWSWNSFIENPILGSGYISSEIYVREHNRYVFILISSGLSTFIPYVLFLGGLTISIRRMMLKLKEYKLAGASFGYFLFACQIMFLVKLFNEGMETFFYWIFFSLAAAWIRNCRREVLELGGKQRREKSKYVPIASGLYPFPQ